MNAPAPPPATEAAGPLRLDATSAVELSGELAARVDAADSGVDRLLVTETARDPFQVLAAAAQRTTRVELGTGVAIAFARTPMTLAVSAWDLQRSSGGRAVIGLGSQVRAHIERRYGMPWSRPAARMREFVLATRAIWDAWQHRTKLEVRGEFYHHTLMMAPFDPGPLPHPAPPVLLAAVGPRMARVAGEVADGIICHPMATPEHLRDQVLPRVFEARRAAEAAGAAWTRRPFEVCGACWPRSGAPTKSSSTRSPGSASGSPSTARHPATRRLSTPAAGTTCTPTCTPCPGSRAGRRWPR